jgi:uncharacterized repeat protein (TIGR03833 family)
MRRQQTDAPGGHLQLSTQMNDLHRHRANVQPGMTVLVVLKQDQHTGRLTQGVVQDILTRSASHPHGIKVRLQNGLVGRVQQILGVGTDQRA